METVTSRFVLVTLLCLTGFISMAQNSDKPSAMKTFLIERNIPAAGKFTPDQLKSISQKSCDVIKEIGPNIQWMHSYVTGDKIYCVYKAESEDVIREHAKKGGFPANVITEISSIIGPATAKD